MGASLLSELNKSFRGSTRKQVEDLLGSADFSLPPRGGMKQNARQASGEDLNPGEAMIGYVLMNAPPFPQEYTENLWMKFDSHGSLDHAWIDNGLFP